ncbi:MAG: hypothetical protein ACP5GJ_03470 [Nanopusillaceae archaeon]|jgi:hypothetical protein
MDELEIDLGNLLFYRKNTSLITEYANQLSKKEKFILYLADALYYLLTKGNLIISPYTKTKISKSQVMQMFEVSSETAKGYLDIVDNEMKNLDPTISYIYNGTLYIFLKALEDNIRVELYELDFKIRTDGYILIAYTNDDIINNILVHFIKNVYSEKGYEIIEKQVTTTTGKRKRVLLILRHII